jgi:hypothetical protein
MGSSQASGLGPNKGEKHEVLRDHHFKASNSNP